MIRKKLVLAGLIITMGLSACGGEKDTVVDVGNMERPQIYIEDGVPKILICACMREEDYDNTLHSFNVRLPLCK